MVKKNIYAQHNNIATHNFQIFRKQIGNKHITPAKIPSLAKFEI